MIFKKFKLATISLKTAFKINLYHYSLFTYKLLLSHNVIKYINYTNYDNARFKTNSTKQRYAICNTPN